MSSVDQVAQLIADLQTQPADPEPVEAAATLVEKYIAAVGYRRGGYLDPPRPELDRVPEVSPEELKRLADALWMCGIRQEPPLDLAVLQAFCTEDRLIREGKRDYILTHINGVFVSGDRVRQRDGRQWFKHAAEVSAALDLLVLRVRSAPPGGVPKVPLEPTLADSDQNQSPEEEHFKPIVKQVPELGLSLDLDNRRATRGEKVADFGSQEKPWDIICALCERHPSHYQKADLLDAIWGKGLGSEGTLFAHITTLRRLIAPLDLDVKCVRKLGYVLEQLAPDKPQRKAEQSPSQVNSHI
jgi:DNA-binding winged helix-turn-helix (wHTH) protein